MIEPMAAQIDQQRLAQELVEQARAEGVELVGQGGLLTGLMKSVLETALEAEMTEHLGYDKHDSMGRNGGNSRNGTRTKTVLTEIGPVDIEVPRDREGTFAPAIVRKRQRRLTGVDEIVLSLSARGLTTGEIAAHFAEVYGATVSKDTISRITDKVIDEMTEWRNRPLDRVYPVLFFDAIVVKVRDGQVVNRPIYVVIGVTVNGERDILGLWAGDGNEGAILARGAHRDQNRGVEDVCLVVCDGLQGLPESITTTWAYAQVQACILHLIRNTSATPAANTGTNWPATCARSTPRSMPRWPQRASRNSPTNGPVVTRPSSSCGARHGRNLFPSSTTTSRSERSFARPTLWKASTAATAAPSEPGDTSRPTRLP
jgi:transposase-like protein